MNKFNKIYKYYITEFYKHWGFSKQTKTQVFDNLAPVRSYGFWIKGILLYYDKWFDILLLTKKGKKNNLLKFKVEFSEK